MQIVIHSFEIESNLRFEQIRRTLHPVAGYKPEQTQKALDKELEKRNKKLDPLGELKLEEGDYVIEMAFKWKDLRDIAGSLV